MTINYLLSTIAFIELRKYISGSFGMRYEDKFINAFLYLPLAVSFIMVECIHDAHN